MVRLAGRDIEVNEVWIAGTFALVALAVTAFGLG